MIIILIFDKQYHNKTLIHFVSKHIECTTPINTFTYRFKIAAIKHDSECIEHVQIQIKFYLRTLIYMEKLFVFLIYILLCVYVVVVLAPVKNRAFETRSQ